VLSKPETKYNTEILRRK